MQSNVEDKEILNTIKLDVSLIHEAVRRLNEGTCCLNNLDEVESAQHLLNQTRGALKMHMDLEELLFEDFAENPEEVGLGEGFFSKMKSEHRHLNDVLMEIKRELEGRHAIAYHAILKFFTEELRRHTQLETSVPYLNILKHTDKDTLNRIRERVERGYVD